MKFRKINKKKLAALLTTGIILCTTPTILAGCNEETKNISGISRQDLTETKIFAPGEHIISVPVDPLDFKITQIPYHPGYKVVGISDKRTRYYSVTHILYVNEKTVECHLVDYGNDYYDGYADFGTPIKEKTKSLK